ncbi:MAG: sigma-70 family RNA polymerase sigma factor [Bacilli bacterium]|nr:sigma-70 family RNA polymerase sigma factor [Bacilli bacterium]
MRLKDKLLVKRILSKDEEAFNQLYYRYKNLICYHVSNACKKNYDIDDIVQDIFLKIVENIKYYRSELSSLTTWISVITRNHIIDYLKKTDDIIYDNEYIENLTSPEDHFDYEFDEYTKELTVLEKDILVLKNIYKLPHAEICKALNITIDVSKKAYKRATNKAYKEWKSNETKI